MDANCGWTATRRLQNAQALAAYQVEFIEQPLPAAHRAEQQRIFAESKLPMIADESCIEPDDVGAMSGLVSRHQHQARKMWRTDAGSPYDRPARMLGLKVMVGCMTESTVGISAIAQLLPAARLRRHGRRRPAGPGYRHRLPAGKRPLSVCRRQRNRGGIAGSRISVEWKRVGSMKVESPEAANKRAGSGTIFGQPGTLADRRASRKLVPDPFIGW